MMVWQKRMMTIMMMICFYKPKKIILSCASNVSAMKNTDHVPRSSPREVILQCCQRLVLLADNSKGAHSMIVVV